ncbi:hypothetical protein D1BOALGB6SA_7668 [Olavius sp. associated proteobacterium Delta 1]|nr:hypothetical protein D1BOALGB6SA_7668 [Olavius sp. associated proteobacterium Delta 1]
MTPAPQVVVAPGFTGAVKNVMVCSEKLHLPELCTSPPEADKSEAFIFSLTFMLDSGDE